MSLVSRALYSREVLIVRRIHASAVESRIGPTPLGERDQLPRLMGARTRERLRGGAQRRALLNPTMSLGWAATIIWRRQIARRLLMSLTLAWLWLSQPGVVGALVLQGNHLEPLSLDSPGQLLVKFRPGVDPVVVAARHGATIVGSIPSIAVYLLAVPPGTAGERLAALTADPEVEFAELNGTVTVPEQPPANWPIVTEPTMIPLQSAPE